MHAWGGHSIRMNTAPEVVRGSQALWHKSCRYDK